MAKNDQNEFPLPNGSNSNKRESARHLPKYFRTDKNQKFLKSTLDQVLQPGVAEKISSFVGRKTAKSYVKDDNYLSDISADRTNYQLEPASIIQDSNGNVDYHADYRDYINQIANLGGSNINHGRNTKEEFYSWDPKIDWDKFSNFREYYWLPNGPRSVFIPGEQKEITSTYTVELAEALGDYSYVFTPDGLTNNPILKLYRGVKYRFEINTPGLPLTFKTQRTLDDAFLLVDGISAQKVDEGVIELELGSDAPDELFYVSSEDINSGGLIRVANQSDAQFIDVVAEIIGKKEYQTRDNWSLTNGLKVRFRGDVQPELYRDKEWYVEGVGEEIELVSATDVEVSFPVGVDVDVPFDNDEGFDQFPFSQATGYPRDKDYITINRASPDGNFWSRYNRWFHKDVIELVDTITNNSVTVDETARASRPIIEFESGLRLYNFGSFSKGTIDLIDTFTTDAFSTIEGSLGYNIDDIQLSTGMRVIFLADTDPLVTGKVFEVKFIKFKGSGTDGQITLVPTTDSEPSSGENVLVTRGTENGGKIWYYDGNKWSIAQEKTSVNTPPIFDVFDENDISYSNINVYPASSFRGSKIFGYKVGTGANDTALGFPLSYKSIENVGDIVFDFNFNTDTFQYQTNDTLNVVDVKQGFLRKYKGKNFTIANVYTKANTLSEQKVILQYVNDNTRITYPINCYDRSSELTDLSITVLCNNIIKYENIDYEFENSVDKIKSIKFKYDLDKDASIIIKCSSSAVKNNNGYYEIANNLEKNPLNEDLTSFTLGEVNDHVFSITENVPNFNGIFPGPSNLRDLDGLSKYGRKFIKHSSPLNLSMYSLIDRPSNIINAVRYSKKEYAKFKRLFIETAESIGYSGNVKGHVDKIITELVKSKTNVMPFYFSDMIPFGTAITTKIIVEDIATQFYALNTDFTLETLSTRAVTVYLNSEQLIHNKDYTFNTEGFLVITATKSVGDIIEINEYDTTNGSFIPPTPSKLGLYPVFEPYLYQDTSFSSNPTVIKGHDGSIVKAFGDYRDALILELEKRIFNNIKINYDPTLFNVHSYVPGLNRNTAFTRKEINAPLTTDFLQWMTLVDKDYTVNSYFDTNNPFTFNYSLLMDKNGDKLPGWWRAIYRYYFDTDSPHLTPWEMLGFSIKPSWWEDQYGPAPYTKNNSLLWEDLERGIIRDPSGSFKINKLYRRPGLKTFIPVNASGELLGPSNCNIPKRFDTQSLNRGFVFGDGSPVEDAWINSSEYPFAILTSWLINSTPSALATGFDRSRQVRNSIGHIIYKDTKNHIKLEDLCFPTGINESAQKLTSGFVNYIQDYMSYNLADKFVEYQNNIKSIKNRLTFKLGGFTDKSKFKLILDSRTPTNEGNVFIPEENYQVFLNTSTPIKTINYSGVIVEKVQGGFSIRGYDKELPYFKYYQSLTSSKDIEVNVGGVSDSYIEWNENRTYAKDTIIENNGSYYRTNVTFTSGNVFDSSQPTELTKLAKLPVTGGRNATFKSRFNKDDVLTLSYGTILTSIQDVIDFLLGYEHWLVEQGFRFQYFDGTENIISDWKNASREFLFWTSHSWGEGALISLSPAADQVWFNTEYAKVDSVTDNFFGYGLLKSDGKPLESKFLKIDRIDRNNFKITPTITADGVYSIKIPLTQTEHVVMIDNSSVFGDVVYQPATGYRQDRIKAFGYRTTDWNGSLDIPGFIYSEVIIKDWQQWTDYAVGDMVKYKEFNYTADAVITGSETFDYNQWVRLNETPQSKLIPNFEYKTNQFADFYDLDTDNFDVVQQQQAQHLIGYQKRKYLENIINDEVSQYKFYQGMIQEKGTRNSLDKLFDVLSANDRESLDFYEEWAIKQGQYGASEGFDEVEFKLDEKKFRLNPQPIQLTNSDDVDGLVYNIKDFEVYKKPLTYNNNFLPQKTDLKSFTRSPGFVNLSDIDVVLADYNGIANLDIESLSNKDYLWVGSKENKWNVLQYVSLDTTITSIETLQQKITDTTAPYELEITLDNSPAGIKAGDILGIFNVQINDDAQDGSTETETTNTRLSQLKGFYRVTKKLLNKIYFESNVQIEKIPSCEGLVTTFKSVKVSDYVEANKIAQQGIDEGSLIWIENTENDWKVLKNTQGFNLLQQIPAEETGENNYGGSITVDNRNSIMSVSSPIASNNGKLFIYSRGGNSQNYQFTQIVEPATSASVGSGQLFGTGQAISADGKYLVVGAPGASNVKSRYKGEFVSTQDYDNKDIVQYDGLLWEVVVDIQGAQAQQQFGSFGAIAEVLQNNNIFANEAFFKNMLTGNYPFTESEEDTHPQHVLVRAPADQYSGTTAGDVVYMEWNEFTSANQDIPTTTARLPFNNEFPAITQEFLESGLTIQKKVDVILEIPVLSILPQIGDQVEATGVFGYVNYVYVSNNRAVIYIERTNGAWPLIGQLFKESGEVVGAFQRAAPTDSIDVNAELGGYWFFDTGADIELSANNVDEARGLVVYNVIPTGEVDTDAFGANIWKYNNTQSGIYGSNADNSYIRTLTYQGTPGPADNLDIIPSDLFIVRAPKALTDNIVVGDEIGLEILRFPSDADGSFIDITPTGLTYTQTNKKHTLYDLWEGYIDFDLDETNSVTGAPFEPKVGQFVRERTPNPGATAKVVYYQKFNNSKARVYVTNVLGDWGALGTGRTIEYIGIPTDPDPAYNQDQVLGDINAVSLGDLVADNLGIGKLCVFQLDAEIETVPAESTIIGAEYIIYKDTLISGQPLLANPPSSINLDYTQVFKIPVNPDAPGNNLNNFGYFSVFQKENVSSFNPIDTFILPDVTENLRIGSKIKIAKRNDLYKVLIGAQGNGTLSNPGKIFFINKGTDAEGIVYDWETSKDKRYKGVFSTSTNYIINDYVYYSGYFYKALTNIAGDGTTFTATEWQLVNNDQIRSIDYLGYIPNDTGTIPEDLDYKGFFTPLSTYTIDEIVQYFNGNFYKAKRNIPLGYNEFVDVNGTIEVPAEDWELISFVPGGDTELKLDQTGLIEFGRDFDISDNGEVLVVSAKFDNDITKVVVYRNINDNYQKSQELIHPSVDETDSQFGTSISISQDGKMIAIGAPLADDSTSTNVGKVFVYTQKGNTFVLTQTLSSVNEVDGELFGKKIEFDGNSLFVSAFNASSDDITTFDSNATVFDNEFTTYKNEIASNGVVYAYERIDESLIFGQSIDYHTYAGRDSIAEVDFFGRNILAKNNHLYVSVPQYQNANGKKGLILDYRRPDNERIWTQHRVHNPPADIDKIKKVMLYDLNKNEVITNLDYIDPIQGKIAGPADEEIRYKTPNDPAVYTNNNNLIDNITIDSNRSWGPEQTGRVWWNLTNAKFYNVYQSNLIYKSNNFNTLFKGSSIDVYEWVESTLTPEGWNNDPDTTGTAIYDSQVYSTRRVYDNIAKRFTNYYYFWVKDKTTIPNIPGRSLSIDAVAKLIADPSGQKYKFISFSDTNSFVLHNVGSLIEDTNTVLNIQYWTSGDKYSNIHNQYQIVTEGLSTSIPNEQIVNKLIDSLVGYDVNSRPVPNPNLSPKEKYGILNRPRQGWFINRVEVLKQVIERVNVTLLQNLITDEKDISALQLNDLKPTSNTNKFDTTVDNYIDLNFVSTVRAKSAVLTPIIENGKLVRVDIVDGGRSYKTAPTYKIDGQGTGADVEFTLDVLGQITQVTVISQGYNYDDNTSIEVRPFAVLVNADETVNNKWAIYHFINNSWVRVASQAYDVTAYWDYVDWYATDYNKFTEIDHVLDYTYNLQGLDDRFGDIVKILNVGGTGWLLLEKIDNQDTTDYTVNYKTIGKENGTVQLSSSLYSFADNLVGFDNQTFDTQFFDKQPIAELRILLNALKDDIFITNLANEFNNIFFLCLRYVFSEQGYVDWAFKTSFVKAQHNVGELQQKTTFKNDNLTSYEAYIQEVKPYKSKIREYISNYSKLETASNVVTDFDSPPRYDSSKGTITTADIKVLNGVLFGTGNALDIDSNWLNNLSYEVTKIEVSDAGEGYISRPEIVIEGNATALASLGPTGNISSITVIEPGSGYIELPTITINGTLKDGGRDAVLTAVLGNSPVRNMHTIIKFDRLSGTFFITQMNETESFTASGGISRFDLKWPMDLRTNTIDISVNGELILSSDYTFSNVKDTTSTVDKYFARIEFINPPAAEAVVQINYRKSIDLLDAQDRINLFYNPTTGQLGKDLSQLMDGVDYGGVQVKSFEFGAPPGWDTGDWYTDNWDIFDETFDDETFETDGSTVTFDLVKPLAKDVKYNVYINGQRVDDDTWDGTSTVEGNTYAFMAPIVGDGLTNTFTFENEIRYRQVVEELDSSGLNNPPANVITLRRATSDGSRVIDESAYDTAITGGDLAYSTATGIKAEDINVDGDGFVTATTSKGPEETVPGQVMDTLDLQVYERPTSGTGVIEVDSFQGNGTTTTYTLTQRPYSVESVIVKIDYIIVDSSKYTINFKTNEVLLYEAPAIGAKISIISISLGGTNLLDYGNFTTDASTTDYETAIPYSENNSAYVTVNGSVLPFTLENVSGVTHIKFAETPPENRLVQYGIFNSTIETFSQISIDKIIADGSSTAYELSRAPFEQQPTSYHTIITATTTEGAVVTENVLTAGYSEAFTVETDVLEYKMKVWQIPVGSVEGSELKVFLNDRELTFLQEWTYEGAGSFNRNISADAQPGSTIILQRGVAAPGDELKVFVLSSGEYRFGYFDSANDFIDTSGKQIPAVLTPVIESGQITSVTVVSGGRGYNTDSGISASSDAGVGAQFTIDVNEVGSIINVTVVDAGTNYDADTTLNVEIVPIPAVIYFDKTYPVDTVIKVYQFSNHNGLGIEREKYEVVQQTEMTVGTKGYYDYRNLTNNFIDLRSAAISVNFVWISVNGKLLTPTADYILRENKKRIQFITPLNDYDTVDVIQFAAPPVSNRFGWRQFKDMLNRTTYLRLSSEDEHTLSAPLRWYDRSIQVGEGYERLPQPTSTVPGVLFIEGERIEFFRRDGNVLKQLRRGTMGTGVKDEYTAETIFYHQGADSILPYKDEEERFKVISGVYTDTSKIYPNSSVDITATSIVYSFNNNTVFPVRVPGTYDQIATVTGTGFRPGVKVLMQNEAGDIRELEKISSTTTEIQFYTETMSVGAYDLVILNPKETAPALRAEEYLVLPKYLPYVQILVPYNPEAFTDVVKNPTETGEWYKAPFDEGGIPEEYWQALNIEVFANGKRLRKTPTKVYDVTKGPDSPNADIDIEADYAVNKNEGAYVRLTTPPEANTTLIIIRKLGTEWRELDEDTSSTFKPLGESNTEIATFLRGKTINLPR